MTPSTKIRKQLVATRGDQLYRLERLLERADADTTFQVLNDGGETIEVPSDIVAVLHQVVHAARRGEDNVSLTLNGELTRQQAADLLDVSPPYLIQLLEDGVIPVTKGETHPRIRYHDLMSYKRISDRERDEALAEITSISQEAGLYDLDQ